MFCKGDTKNNSEKLTTAIESLIQTKNHCVALIAKNERLRVAYGKDIKCLSRLAAPPHGKIRRLLIQRKMLGANIDMTNRHILAIFKHQLTIEQAILHGQIGESLMGAQRAIAVSNDNLEEINSVRAALDDMAASVCEVSEVLLDYGQMDIDESDSELEAELEALLASPTSRIAVTISPLAPIAPSSPIRVDVPTPAGYIARMES